ncbi:polyprenyl synthetase family protein [bacterium]|nr:polyprenyl synthetase family protein [bacterium]
MRAEQLKNYINLVEERIGEILADSDQLVTRYVTDISKSRGKRLRPRMLLSFAEIFGGAEFSSAINCSACCELLHTATLIHDDIIDEAHTRRGNLTLNSMYGNEVAVIVGDYVLALVLKSLNLERDFQLTEMLLDTSQELGMGVIEEVLNRNNFRLSVEKYYDVIHLKTAVLFSLCCSMGAYLGGADERRIKLAGEYGRLLGLAFQIVDDLLDLTQDEESTGKPVMSDLREGRITLALVHSLMQDAPHTQQLAERYQESHAQADADAIKAHLFSQGSIQFSMDAVRSFIAQARGVALQLADEVRNPDWLDELEQIERRVLEALPAGVASS